MLSSHFWKINCNTVCTLWISSTDMIIKPLLFITAFLRKYPIKRHECLHNLYEILPEALHIYFIGFYRIVL